jgi:protein TonB
MNFAQDNKASSRTTAFVLVVLLHILMIWGLANGLVQKAVSKITEPIETKVIEAPKPPPPPPEKIVPPPPDLKTPPPPFVPVPEIQVATPPPPNAIQAPTSIDPPPARPIQASPAPTPPAPVAAPKPAGPVRAGVVCTKMPKPEISVQLEGEAEFDVLLTIRNGKVVAQEVTVRRGLSDRRAQRSLLSSIQTAVGQYECGTFEGQVTQPFLFRPE